MSEAGKNQFEENEKSERETILQVKNLKKYYMVGRKGLFGEKEYVRSVDGVSFELHRGETLAIVGESGCGKSTTVKSLLRVVEPTDGEVILNRQDFLKLKGADLKKARRNIKMIFQDPYSSLNPRMTVRDVNDFVTLSAPLCRVSLSDGFRIVDGKSFMEIFCLRLSGPITVHAECTEEEFHRFFQEAQRFLLP